MKRAIQSRPRRGKPSGRLAWLGLFVLCLPQACSDAPRPFVPPPLECPEGAEAELIRFSENRIESNRMLSDVGLRCLKPDGTRHGPSKEWYANGQPSAVTEWDSGEKHGHFVLWYQNGQKKAEGEHRHWKPYGEWTNWDEQGNVIAHRDFGRDGDAPKSETAQGTDATPSARGPAPADSVAPAAGVAPADEAAPASGKGAPEKSSGAEASEAQQPAGER